MTFPARVHQGPLLHFRDCGAGFARTFGLEDLIKLFQGATLSLHEEEIDKDKLKNVPEDEENVEPISNLRKPISVSWGRARIMLMKSSRLVGFDRGERNARGWKTYIVQSDWRSKGVDKTSAACSNLKYPHALGPHVVT